MFEKKYYTLKITTRTQDQRITDVYEKYRKIKFRYNKQKRTCRAVLIDEGGKTIIEKINVESVVVEPY